ncbi:MAG: hypothetical protein A2X86_17285 [Bdellovibrionales bacterium GWA2_49_15]|nr:MAG: hypothetical protein A2X86_17285 [Bdellovibrionales bacterium GWA2_49_15]HAZ14007.1 hypothetical protein [Bdellovibrionales bacterium]
MSKDFAPRVSKRERKSISFDDQLYRFSDSKLLEGARLAEIKLKDIQVKEQVRTKFNDDSIRDLAANIRTNGLIQPLVIHLKNSVYRLICGERRFRAMSLIEQESAPCFILENKSAEELMAIQFSENSSREELHYVDKAEGIFNYHAATQASERKIVEALGISKSEVHRGLQIARLSQEIREAAKKYDVEKYVLLELEALPSSPLKQKIEKKIIAGEVTKRNDLKKLLKQESKEALKISLPVDLDPETLKAIRGLVMKSKEGLEEKLS